MDIRQIIDVIMSIENDNVFYMVNPITSSEGFFTIEKKLLYVAKDIEGYISEGIETDFLKLQTHIHVSAVENDHTFENDDYNIIMFKGDLKDQNIEAFVHLCEIHARNPRELKFRDFFYSLIKIFQLPSEQSYINAVGLFGELKLIQYTYEKFSIDISKQWHSKGSRSKYDFSNGKICIEVKTTSSDDGRIEIKHSQIFDEERCYLVAMACDQSDIGETLEELVVYLQETDAFNSLEFAVNLAKEKNRVSESDYKKQRFSLKDINMYESKDINPFPDYPDNVSSLVYKMDLSDYQKMTSDNMLSILKTLVIF